MFCRKIQRGDRCVRKRWGKTALNKGEHRQSCVQISSSGLLSDIFKAFFLYKYDIYFKVLILRKCYTSLIILIFQRRNFILILHIF